MFRWPFRFRYWVVQDKYPRRILVVRRRFSPSEPYDGLLLLDGPFDTTDDAARSLAFWTIQYSLKKPNKGANHAE